MKGARIVVPAVAWRSVLKRLHTSHQGIERTKQRARQTVWWPSINNDITTTVKTCDSCQQYQCSQQKEPLLNQPIALRAFEAASADFCHHAGKTFLVYADRWSGWTEVYPVSSTTAKNTIRGFCHFFASLGVPVRLRTDGGPPFTSHEFGQFLMRWGVQHEISSPHHPQGNGHAEASVKKMKLLIKEAVPNGNIATEEFMAGLQELRNTPGPSNVSPAQLLFGHPLRSFLPALPESLNTNRISSLTNTTASQHTIRKK